MEATPNTLTLTEAARLCGVSQSALKSRIYCGSMRGRMVRGRWRIAAEDGARRDFRPQYPHWKTVQYLVDLTGHSETTFRERVQPPACRRINGTLYICVPMLPRWLRTRRSADGR